MDIWWLTAMNFTENYNKMIDKTTEVMKIKTLTEKTEMANNTIRYVTVHSHLMLESLLVSASVFSVCPQGWSQAIVFYSSSFESNLWWSHQLMAAPFFQKLGWPQGLYWKLDVSPLHWDMIYSGGNPGGGAPLPSLLPHPSSPHPCGATGVKLVGLVNVSNSWIQVLTHTNSSRRFWFRDCTSRSWHWSCQIVVWASSHSQSVGCSPW